MKWFLRNSGVYGVKGLRGTRLPIGIKSIMG